MRPDARLAPALGLVPAAGETVDGYAQINTATQAGAGLPTETLPFRGRPRITTSARGAESVAALSSAAAASEFVGPTTGPATGFPAVVKFGRTATWSFDLARSVAYVRQGTRSSRAWSETASSPSAPPTCSTRRSTWTGCTSRTPTSTCACSPGSSRTCWRTSSPCPGSGTSRAHAGRCWSPRATSTTRTTIGNLVAAFEARDVRGSLYVVDYNRAPDADTLAQLQQAGHEFGLHPWVLGATPWGLSDLEAAYDLVLGWFTARSAVPSRTIRLHQVAWFGWVDAARVAARSQHRSRHELLQLGTRDHLHGWPPGQGLHQRQRASHAIRGRGGLHPAPCINR